MAKRIKLDKIQEACELLVMKSNVSILEEAANSGLTEMDIAKSKLIIHESLTYIKKSLTDGGILESTQKLLANNWTQAILEDMDMVDNASSALANGKGPLSDAYTDGINKVQAAADTRFNDAQSAHDAEMTKIGNATNTALANADKQNTENVLNVQAAANTQNEANIDAIPGARSMQNLVAGAKDLQKDFSHAVESGKTMVNDTVAAAKEIPGQVQTIAKNIPSQVSNVVDSTVAAAKEVPGQVQTIAKNIPGQANDAYNDVAAAGGKLFNEDGTPLSGNTMAGVGAGGAVGAIAAGLGARNIVKRAKI